MFRNTSRCALTHGFVTGGIAGAHVSRYTGAELRGGGDDGDTAEYCDAREPKSSILVMDQGAKRGLERADRRATHKCGY